MKVIALYLPQYHVIKENSRWWGEGYTEWTAVKKAKPLYQGHRQPRVPLHHNYYDLSDEDAVTWKWQADLVNKSGIYGFCIYHYWFKGKQLLEKPMEILLHHPEIKINYCINWANESWTRTWYGLEKEILMAQDYGDREDWEAHFRYMLKFFRDDRYIKIDHKPLINIYRSKDIFELKDMLNCWRGLAKENGFDGLYVVVSNNAADQENREDLVDAFYDFEPGYSTKNNLNKYDEFLYYSKILTSYLYNRIFKKQVLERKVDIRKVYKRILKRHKKQQATNKPVFPGLFPMWDNTPRRGYAGTVYVHESPKLFYKILRKLCSTVDKNDFIFINAWNEWGEGCYLEPDSVTKYRYLKAIKKVTDKLNGNEILQNGRMVGYCEKFKRVIHIIRNVFR